MRFPAERQPHPTNLGVMSSNLFGRASNMLRLRQLDQSDVSDTPIYIATMSPRGSLRRRSVRGGRRTTKPRHGDRAGGAGSRSARAEITKKGRISKSPQ